MGAPFSFHLRGDSGLDVNAASRVLDLELLDEARTLYLVGYTVQDAAAVADLYGGPASQDAVQFVPGKFNRRRGKGNRGKAEKRQVEDGLDKHSGPKHHNQSG